MQAWIDKLIAAHEVYAPVEGEGASTFKKLQAGQTPALSAKTDMSPKGIIFKQVERLLSYERTDGTMGINDSSVGETVAVAFGVRPCDARAISLTDKVFVDSEMPEPKY